MTALPHIPLLRAGEARRSLQVESLADIRTGEPIAEVSQALTGVIARDLGRRAELQRRLDERPAEELVGVCRRAAEHFLSASLPLGDTLQEPEEYLQQLAATSGMPLALGRSNMAKIAGVLEAIDEVLDGLTRGLDLTLLDRGWGEQEGRRLSFVRRADALGLVLPNNSPGVHTLWLPALPLKVPLVIRPGSAEPWTPYRIAQALFAAGAPPEALSFYPAGHDGATQVLLGTERSMFFGDAATVEGWRGGDRVQVHGPGWSKVLLDDGAAEAWPEHVDLMVGSIAANGGRSCINASGVWTPAHGRDIAEALAERLAAIEARGLDDPAAALAAFPDPRLAERLSASIDQQLARPGAEDVTERHRPGGRLAQAGGCTFLLPTVIYCEDPAHPLAHAEYLFPFAAVVETPTASVLDAIGPTLVATILQTGSGLGSRAAACRHIDRLNLGPVPTYQMSWDQPHEGNLFDHLYQRRAFQAAASQ